MTKQAYHSTHRPNQHNGARRPVQHDEPTPHDLAELDTRIAYRAPESDYPEATPLPPRSTTWNVNEAPASCCLKWSINGLEIMYTMRDVDDDRLFARVGRIMPKIEAKLEAAKQARQAEKQAQSQTQSTGGNGGNGTNQGTTAATPPEEDEHYCHYHDEPLKQFTKDGRSWYSHKTDDGQWCRGK